MLRVDKLFSLEIIDAILSPIPATAGFSAVFYPLAKSRESIKTCMQCPFSASVERKHSITVKRFEKFSLNFSILLFVIRVNLLHP